MATKFSQLPNGNLIQVGSQLVGLSSAIADTRYDFPGTGIRNADGGMLLGWAGTSASTNYVYITGPAGGGGVPAIGVDGVDDNISLNIYSVGSGEVIITPGTTGKVSINSETCFDLPSGNTAQRPLNAVPGSERYNTDIGGIEYYDGADWISGGGGGTVLSVSGTADRITSTGGDHPVINIDPDYAGQTSIITLGNVTIGTWQGAIVTPQYGGTGVNNAANTLSLAGPLSTSGAFTSIFTMTGATNVTFPTSGTLLTSAALANYATLNSTNDFNFNIQYREQVKDYSETVNILGNITGATTFDLTLGNVISATATGNSTITVTNVPATGQCASISLIATNFGAHTITWMAGIQWLGSGVAPTLQGAGTDALVFFTVDGGTTWYGALSGFESSGGTVTSVIGTANQINVVNPTTTPLLSIAPTYVGQTSITTLGTITSGTWNSTVVAGQYGGTGVANTGKTITLGGNLTTSGAFASTFTMTNTTNVTFPTSGTLSTTTGTVTSVASGTGLTGGPITSTGTLAVVVNDMCSGRLTLTSGVPVTTTDVTGATTIYFTPYKGNYITLYDGAWKLYTFSQLSIAVPSVSNTMYDVFMYDNAGVLTLYLQSWTNRTTRSLPLTLQDGVYVLSGPSSYRYLGSFLTMGIGVTEDSSTNRYVWNYYNRVMRNLQYIPTGNTNWTYTSGIIRQANGSSSFQVNLIVGVLEDNVLTSVSVMCAPSTTGDKVIGIGINSTSAYQNNSSNGSVYSSLSTSVFELTADYNGLLSTVGLNNITWLEACNGGSAVMTASFTTSGYRLGLRATFLM